MRSAASILATMLAATVTLAGMSACSAEGEKASPVLPATSTPETSPPEVPETPKVDKRYGSCKAANKAGLGPYLRGVDPEYRWYRDRDDDGSVCEP